MIKRLHIIIMLGISVFYWAVALCILDLPITLKFFEPFGFVVMALTVTAALFNREIWKWPLINGWIVKQPVLAGTWRITIYSDWINPDTGKKIDHIPGYLFIRQSFTHLSLKMVTAESGSESISSNFNSEENGTYKLVSVYRNIPKARVRGRSEMHHGTLLLSIASLGNEIEGEYWTDRNSKGSIELVSKIETICNSYDEAEKIFSKTTKEG